MNRTLEQWAALKPDAFLTGSIQQARNVIEMMQQDIAALGRTQDELTQTAERAAKIIKTNLYRQREKVEDAASILEAALSKAKGEQP